MTVQIPWNKYYYQTTYLPFLKIEFIPKIFKIRDVWGIIIEENNVDAKFKILFK